jgi:hypothetical protein
MDGWGDVLFVGFIGAVGYAAGWLAGRAFKRAGL